MGGVAAVDQRGTFRASRQLLRWPLLRVLNDRWRFPSRYDYYEDYLARKVRGKRVIDIGAMWLVDGRFSFHAEACGAREVVAFDILPQSEAFLAEKRKRDSQVRFVQGDLMDPATLELGRFDVVFCCGVLYHLPDPLRGLQCMRALCGGEALIGTAIIGELLGRNRAVYFPYLAETQRRRWAYRSRHCKVGVDTPYQPDEGYANWFWGLSPSCVCSLLATSGFAVDHIHYRRNFAFFECQAQGGELLP